MNAPEFIQRIGSIGLLEFVDFGTTPVDEGTVIRTDLENKYITQVEGQKWHTIMSNGGILTGEVVEGPYQNQTNDYQINFSMTEEGTSIFEAYTKNNVGAFLGIVIDKVVISAPRVQQPISGGQASIFGNFTQKSAQELAVILQTKPLPFPVKLVQK